MSDHQVVTYEEFKTMSPAQIRKRLEKLETERRARIEALFRENSPMKEEEGLLSKLEAKFQADALSEYIPTIERDCGRILKHKSLFISCAKRKNSYRKRAREYFEHHGYAVTDGFDEHMTMEDSEEHLVADGVDEANDDVKKWVAARIRRNRFFLGIWTFDASLKRGERQPSQWVLYEYGMADYLKKMCKIMYERNSRAGVASNLDSNKKKIEFTDSTFEKKMALALKYFEAQSNRSEDEPPPDE